MRTRSTGLTLLGVLAVLATACTSGASPSQSSAAASQAASPSTAEASASTAAASASTAAASPSAAAPQANLKIGVVTDIGTLNDKGYNEYSFKGAVDGAQAIGSPAPQSIVPKDAFTVYADGACLSSRVYPTRSDSLGVDFWAAGGTARETRVIHGKGAHGGNGCFPRDHKPKWRAITIRWTSFVPSPISRIFWSR